MSVTFVSKGLRYIVPPRPAMTPIERIPGDPDHIRRAVEAREWAPIPAWSSRQQEIA